MPADPTREQAPTAAEVKAVRAGCDARPSPSGPCTYPKCRHLDAACYLSISLLATLRHMDAARAAAGMVQIPDLAHAVKSELSVLAALITSPDVDLETTRALFGVKQRLAACVRATLPAQEANKS